MTPEGTRAEGTRAEEALLVGARLADYAAAVLASISPLRPIRLTFDDAHGCTLAEDVIATAPLPPYDISVIDGYAVKAADVASATADNPVVLPVVADINANSRGPVTVLDGYSVRVAAMSRVPVGAETIVPLEATDGGVAAVTVRTAAAHGAGIRPAGCEVADRATVLDSGQVLGVAQLALLAAMGRREALCYPRARVVVVTAAAPDAGPGPASGGDGGGDSRGDGITHALSAGVREAGGIAYRVGAVSDPHEMLTTLEDHLIRADMMLVCGGATLGPHGPRGVLPDVLSALGTVTFTPIAARPLGFVGFGTIGPDAIPFFAVPGDPASALVAFEFLVGPAIRLMAAAQGAIRSEEATLTDPVTSTYGICDLVPVRITSTGPRSAVATPLIASGGQPPLYLLAAADGLAILDEDLTEFPTGTAVRVMLFDKNAVR